jgi:hypothetical protein
MSEEERWGKHREMKERRREGLPSSSSKLGTKRWVPRCVVQARHKPFNT